MVASSSLATAWASHRSGSHTQAASQFRVLLATTDSASASEDNSIQLVDVYYGLGLSERAAGNTQEAHQAFESALKICETLLDALMPNNQNDINSINDDRFLMLANMLRQRLAETVAAA